MLLIVFMSTGALTLEIFMGAAGPHFDPGHQKTQCDKCAGQAAEESVQLSLASRRWQCGCKLGYGFMVLSATDILRFWPSYFRLLLSALDEIHHFILRLSFVTCHCFFGAEASNSLLCEAVCDSFGNISGKNRCFGHSFHEIPCQVPLFFVVHLCAAAVRGTQRSWGLSRVLHLLCKKWEVYYHPGLCFVSAWAQK